MSYETAATGLPGYLRAMFAAQEPPSAPQGAPEVERRPDIGRAAHVAACAHLTRCWEQLDAEEEPAGLDDDDVEHIEAPGDELDTAGPFCGCQDCEVREVLHAAFPVLHAGLVDHLLTTGHATAAHELMRAF